jgi:hypothetical protein
MSDYQDETLRLLTEPPWFGIGRDSAISYACNKDWLFRRVEAIQFVGPRSVRRSISVDFEVPKRLPDLEGLAAEGTALVPISVLQKWPPLMDFHLVDPAGRPTSRYLRTTNKKLDFGLLLGMADLALARGGDRTECPSWELRKRPSVKLRPAEPEGLAPALCRELAAVVQNPRPSQSDVAQAVNKLGAELERRLGKALERERLRDSNEIAMQIAATVDLAARLGDSSILWVAVQGTPGTDRIVKFSYLGPYGESMPQLPEETREPGGGIARPGRILRLWKGLSIRCSWRRRTLIIPLPHAGRQVRFHLDVRAPEGGVELLEAEAMAFPPATADHGDGGASVRSVASLAKRYSGLDFPDELVGPQSSGFYMDYGEPIPLASTSSASDPRCEGQAETDAEASAEIIDRRAHVYLGASGAPSHRVLLQVKLAATRNGFIQGCMIAALMVASLMWISYFNLTSAALHLEPTVVLLSVVPVVLGYVLVRPDEQALERYHVSGVRAMALLSGAMPIVGALTLVLTHRGLAKNSPPDLAVVRPIWCVLAAVSALTAAGLIVSWNVAAPSKAPREGTADSKVPE